MQAKYNRLPKKKRKKIRENSGSIDRINQEEDQTIDNAASIGDTPHIENEVDHLDLLGLLNKSEYCSFTSPLKGSKILSQLLHNNYDLFYDQYWGKRPFHSKFTEESSNFDFFTKLDFDDIISNQVLFDLVDVALFHESDETSGDETANKELSATEIIEKFTEGYTVRLLTAQKYNDTIWKLLSALEFEFDCRVASTVCLTPSESINNNLRKDHVDSFILQLEGCSEWKCYDPSVEPTEGSEKPDSEPSIGLVLEPSGFLYIPKGWTYQQCTPGSQEFSLVLCIHTNFSHSTADLLELSVPQAIGSLVKEKSEFRNSLPRNLRSLVGVAVSENEENQERKIFLAKIEKMLHLVAKRTLEILDPAADQMAKEFTLERLPIPLSEEEELRTAVGSPDVTIFPYTQLRMLRPGIAVSVVEDGLISIYHCMDNSREKFGNVFQPLAFELDDGPAIEVLLLAYPNSVQVNDLPHPSEEIDDKVELAQALYKEGFLMIEDEVTLPYVLTENPKRSRKKQKKSENSKDEIINVLSSNVEKDDSDDDDPF